MTKEIVNDKLIVVVLTTRLTCAYIEEFLIYNEISELVFGYLYTIYGGNA